MTRGWTRFGARVSDGERLGIRIGAMVTAMIEARVKVWLGFGIGVSFDCVIRLKLCIYTYHDAVAQRRHDFCCLE